MKQFISGEKISIIRKQKNISRADLSRMSSVPLRTLENWESKKRTPTDYWQITAVCKALQISVEDITEYDYE